MLLSLCLQPKIKTLVAELKKKLAQLDAEAVISLQAQQMSSANRSIQLQHDEQESFLRTPSTNCTNKDQSQWRSYVSTFSIVEMDQPKHDIESYGCDEDFYLCEALMSLTEHDQVTQAAQNPEADISLFCNEDLNLSMQDTAKPETNLTQKKSLSPSKKWREAKYDALQCESKPEIWRSKHSIAKASKP